MRAAPRPGSKDARYYTGVAFNLGRDPASDCSRRLLSPVYSRSNRKHERRRDAKNLADPGPGARKGRLLKLDWSAAFSDQRQNTPKPKPPRPLKRKPSMGHRPSRVFRRWSENNRGGR